MLLEISRTVIMMEQRTKKLKYLVLFWSTLKK